jgi:O-antigen biosynthesis protein WbqV
MEMLHRWIAILTEAVANEDKSTIRSVLKEAVPEFRLKAG